MGRIVNTDNPGKRRNALMRSSAELMRHLMLQTTISDQTKDMLAQLVFCLREIDEGIDESALEEYDDDEEEEDDEEDEVKP